MRGRYNEGGNPDIKVVVAEYRDAMKQRMRWAGPAIGGAILLLLVLKGLYSVEPGEVGVVRTFGKETGQTQPGLHFAIPIAQTVELVDLAKIRRAEIGFRGTKGGPKRIDSEALMLTGDENIVEAQLIVQYQIQDPSKYLFRLKDPEATLHAAAEVALRGVVGQTTVTASIQDLLPPQERRDRSNPQDATPPATPSAAPTASPSATAATPPAPAASASAAPAKKALNPDQLIDPNADILTTGREEAQLATRKLLQELMNLYESGLKITEVKLQRVDAPDEVKDAFHDVVRAREEREQKINKALGYRQDRIPKARGEAQKIIRAAEAYKKERVLRAEGEANRFTSVLQEYRKARTVTRERLHLEIVERILQRVDNKVFIDADVARHSLPLLPLMGGNPLAAPAKGGN